MHDKTNLSSSGDIFLLLHNQYVIISESFRATGLHPFNPSKVLNKLPPGKDKAGIGTADTSSAAVSDAVLDVLSTMKGGKKGDPTPKKRRTRINVIPGKSVSLEDLSTPSSIASSRSTTPTPTGDKQRKRPVPSETPSCSGTYKPPSPTNSTLMRPPRLTTTTTGKGKGEKSKAQAQLIKNSNDEVYFCLICDEQYMEPMTEDSIQCNKCQQCCHEACAEIELGKEHLGNTGHGPSKIEEML
ncbi:pogo transposable element with krab domain [Plakobranchus ocellatus]|uniref:Pogo transposable element with krab domain n=1 Tax=Plakobranchus ocellatus TaxID=259542 RepID=A0AAV3Z2U6_9GAST|nr:pogo transposable element with krab domain [Plakobranchus ocellatus]